MKFYGEPGLLVRNMRRNGPLKTFKGFRFDANGEYTTENKYIIRLLQGRFATDQPTAPTVDESPSEPPTQPPTGMSEEETRQLGKQMKIKHWHIMSIDKLKKELGV